MNTGLGYCSSIRHGWRFVRLVFGLAVVVAPCMGGAAASAAVVAHWRMDEAGGQMVDDASGGGLDGVLGASSGPDAADPARIAGRWGGALSFAGSDRVTIPDSARLEPARISVEAWVRRSGSPGIWRYIVAKGATGCFASSYGLYSGFGGGLAFYVSTGGRYVLSPALSAGGIWDGRWHYAVGTYDGVRVRLYVDGAQVGAGIPVDLQIRYGLESTTPLIGGYLGSCGLPFSGDIDDVRISNEPLDPAWIAGFAAGGPDATAPATPPPPIAPDPGARGGVYPIPPDQRQPSKSKPKRCFTIAVSTARLRARRWTTIRATVRRDGRPIGRIRIVSDGAGVRVTARTRGNGRALLKLRPRRKGVVRLLLPGRAQCAVPRLTVARR